MKVLGSPLCVPHPDQSCVRLPPRDAAYDLSNLTLLKGDTGWIVIDTPISPETAKAGLDLGQREARCQSSSRSRAQSLAHRDVSPGATAFPDAGGTDTASPDTLNVDSTDVKKQYVANRSTNSGVCSTHSRSGSTSSRHDKEESRTRHDWAAEPKRAARIGVRGEPALPSRSRRFLAFPPSGDRLRLCV